MAPIAGAVVWAVMRAAVDSNACTSTARDDHAEDNGVSHTCAVNSLGGCEAIGIVHHANRLIDRALQIGFNGLAVDPGRTTALAETADGLK
jgi:hypothetical protein